MLQISVQDLHSEMILPIPQGGFFGARIFDGKLCIVDTSLRKYMQKYTKKLATKIRLHVDAKHV